MTPATKIILEYAQNFVIDARRCMALPPLNLLQLAAQQGNAGINEEQ